MTSQILDWLQNNDKYARTIVQLAGVRTKAVEGLKLAVICRWEEQGFQAPVYFDYVSDNGEFAWTALEEKPRLFKISLELLTETFRELGLPPKMVYMLCALPEQPKKPHFIKFTFSDAQSLPISYDGHIKLSKNIWEPHELESAVRELQKIKRKLKGTGYEH